MVTSQHTANRGGHRLKELKTMTGWSPSHAFVFAFAMFGCLCFVYMLAAAIGRSWTRFTNGLYTRGYNDRADGITNYYKV